MRVKSKARSTMLVALPDGSSLDGGMDSWVRCQFLVPWHALTCVPSSVARKAGAGGGQLMPDDAVPTVSNDAASPVIAPEYLLIWKINKQPPNMPFNLTKYALTLNDARPEIKNYLPPTDCRLRPDQHA